MLITDARDLPLCPNSGGAFLHPAHQQANLRGDRLYEAAAPYRNDDREYEEAIVAALMDPTPTRPRTCASTKPPQRQDPEE